MVPERQSLATIVSIATAVPATDFHADYRRWAEERLADPRERKLFARMADRAGIEHRWSVLGQDDAKLDRGSGFYSAAPPTTAERMSIYEREAPELALAAIGKLSEVGAITHLVVASCTGFVAPGIDQIIARRLDLSPRIERTFIGFMGCYAAATALRTARHIVRSEPSARVLVVTVELSSLHHRDTDMIEPLLAGALFGDGAAAAIVTGDGTGLTLGPGISAALEDSGDLITWDIGDHGFIMHLSGEVPSRLAAALDRSEVRDQIFGDRNPAVIDAFAVHAGGRSILDAVEKGLALDPSALRASRQVLADFGNMSSSTLMFVLAALFDRRPAQGIALAFGPGLAMEGFSFGWSDAG
ncbi:type III polyketide synthase [Sphingomicrobium sp. XHP0239]|uniref:type III polyketide synthase n=1 Tax=Sphingomicrobium maritimum TaxID=3133972 RepID=UPI0031CC8541